MAYISCHAGQKNKKSCWLGFNPKLESFTTKSSKDQFYWQGKCISCGIFELLCVKYLLRLPAIEILKELGHYLNPR